MTFGEIPISISVPRREVISPITEIRRDRLSGGSDRLVMIEPTKPDSLTMTGIGQVALIRHGVKMTGDYHLVFAARAEMLPDKSGEISDIPDSTAAIVLGYN